jgi:hypothetical protein
LGELSGRHSRQRAFKRKQSQAGGKGLAILPFLSSFMAATLKKGQLPTKICATCGLPFEYRKKWRNNWEAVKYCGEKCQRNKEKAVSS